MSNVFTFNDGVTASAPGVFTTAGFREYIRSRLGAPFCVVELSDAHIDMARDDALRTFNHWLSELQSGVLWSRHGPQQVQMPETCRGITAVKFLHPHQLSDSGNLNIFEILYRVVFPRFPVSDWYLFRAFYEMFQKVRGTEPDFRYDPATKTLWLDCSGGPFDVYYVGAYDLDMESMRIQKSSYSQKFLDFALACAKETLGEMRGKFTANIPVPGGTLGINSADLRREAAETKKEIISWLKVVTRFSTAVVVG